LVLALLVVSVVTNAACQSAYSDTISALEMRQHCRGVEAATSSRGEISMNVTKYSNALTCFGAFSALTQEIALLDNQTYESLIIPGVCVFLAGNNRVSVKVLVAVFSHFVDEHPEQGGRDFFIVAWDAFKTAWPCTK
jgi:hypothetical protein